MTMTAREMVTNAMRELGVIDGASDPSAAELDDGIVRLNALLKSWEAKGPTPWRETAGTATITAATASVALAPRPVSVSEVRAVISGLDVPLWRWGYGEYSMIRNKATVGAPSLFTLAFTTAAVTMSVHPVPAADTPINYTYARAIAVSTDPSDTVDLPDMWLEAGYLMLAVHMSAMFGSTIEPQKITNIAARAIALEAAMFGHDIPGVVPAVSNA